MPLYEYRCECGTSFDRIVDYKERNIVRCPTCGAIAGLIMNFGGSTEATETVDVMGNKKVIRGAREMLKNRASAHKQEEAVAGEFAAKKGLVPALKGGYLGEKKKCI